MTHPSEQTGRCNPLKTTQSPSQLQDRKAPRQPAVWTRFRFGIQSKILMAMLLSSILGVGVIGLIGAMSGRNALREVESERLIELRESQKRAVEALFREVTNSLIVYSGGFSVNQATTALTAGFAQLANAPITPAQQQSLVNYYDNEMLKPINRATGEQHRSQRGTAEFQRAEIPSGVLHRTAQTDPQLAARPGRR